MKILMSAVAGVVFIGGLFAYRPSDEDEVRQAVQSFNTAFNSHDFSSAEEYTTEDWNHINPFGGSTRGRDAVLKELKVAHSTFLKEAHATIEDLSVRFASGDVAVVTVITRGKTFTTPDGVKHENGRNIMTFVVVKRSGRWLIMQDQNTFISPPPK